MLGPCFSTEKVCGMIQRRWAVFLDRDGTIIEDRHYLCDPRQVVRLPGGADGLGRLMDLDLALVIVTNQSGIGRGFFSEEQARAVHEEVIRQLGRSRVRIDGRLHLPKARSGTDRTGRPRFED